MKRYQEVTIIDFSKGLKDFSNVKDLPEDTQKFLYREITSFSSRGFQEVNGYIGRQNVISMGGHWVGKEGNEKFEITSYGITLPNQLAKDYSTIPKQWPKK